MQTQITVPVGDRNVAVNELTVGQIRAYLRGEELAPVADIAVDHVDLLVEVNGVPLRHLYAMSDLRPADIDACAPSQMAQLVAAVKEANPSFFAVEARLRAAQAMSIAQAEAGGKSASSSSDPSAS